MALVAGDIPTTDNRRHIAFPTIICAGHVNESIRQWPGEGEASSPALIPAKVQLVKCADFNSYTGFVTVQHSHVTDKKIQIGKKRTTSFPFKTRA